MMPSASAADASVERFYAIFDMSFDATWVMAMMFDDLVYARLVTRLTLMTAYDPVYAFA